MKLFTALAVATASISTVANAQTERDLESHEHGTAILNVAIDETAVFIELDTPWNNLVGFEHAPRSDDQKALVDQALATLRQPDQLFLLAGGDCSFSEVDVKSGLAGGDEHDDEHSDEHDDAHSDEHDDEHSDKHDDEHSDKHDDEHSDKHDDAHSDKHDDEHSDKHDDAHSDEHDDEHDDEHSDKHDDEHSDEHDDAHDHDEASSETHSTAVVTYTYSCVNTASIESIDVKLFDVWSGFYDLDVQLIGPGGQALAELAPGQSLLDISQVQ